MATRGETVINELLTKVGLVGGKEATAAAQAYDKALDGVSVSSDGVTKAQLSAQSALDKQVLKYSEVARAARDLAAVEKTIQRTQEQGGDISGALVAREGATNRLTAALQRQAAAQATLADTPIVKPGAMAAANDMVSVVRGAGNTAQEAGKSFGLAGYQTRNLINQFTDLAVQIGSGGGIFRPLLQQGPQIADALSMSEGGIGGALRGIGAGLARIGPLAIAAFGTAGLLGAVSAASVALANHGAELERQEARLRAFSTRAADVIGIAQRATAGLGLASTGGFRDLTEQVVRFGAALGVINVETFVTNFARLSTTLHATAAESDLAAAAFAKLAAQGNLTSGDLIAFAEKFPQFAKVAADAMNVTTDQLLTMSETIPVAGNALVDAVNRGGVAADANVRPWNELSSSIGRYIDELSRAASSSLDQFLDTTAREVYGLAAAWNAVVNAVDGYIQKALEAVGIQIPDAPQGGGGGGGGGGGSTAPQPTQTSQADRDAYYKRDIVGGEDVGSGGGGGSSSTGERTLKEIHEGNVRREREADAAVAATDKVYDAVTGWRTTNLQDGKQMLSPIVSRMDQAEQHSIDTWGHLTGYEEEAAAARWRGNWGQEKAADQAHGDAQAIKQEVKDNGQRIITGLGRILKAPFSLGEYYGAKWDMADRGFDSGIAAGNAAAFGPKESMGGTGSVNKYDRAWINFTLYWERQQAMADALSKGASSQASATDKAAEAAEAASAATKEAVAELDVGSLGSPIQTKIDSLRGLQETALSRVYRPDPYAEKNPEFFYNGERIFKSGQDKIYDGLQRQITKLEQLQSSLSALVTQGDALPTTLVNALIAAGFGDIAQQIVTAFQSSTPPPASATPPPTVVQAGAIAPAGATTATTAPKLGFYHMGI